MIKHEVVDKIGFWASFICGIHCIGFSFIIIFLPYLSILIFTTEKYEKYFIVISMIFASGSICWGWRSHRRTIVFIPLSLGILLLLMGILWHDHHYISMWRNVFGGVFLSLSHYLNYLMCKSCDLCEHKP